MVDHYHTLFAIIHYYDTIMTVISIIAINALFSIFGLGKSPGMKVPETFSGTFTNSPYNWYNAYNSVIIEK